MNIRKQNQKHEMDDIQAENTLRAIPRSKFIAVRNQLLTCMTSEPAERESLTEHSPS